MGFISTALMLMSPESQGLTATYLRGWKRQAGAGNAPSTPVSPSAPEQVAALVPPPSYI